MFEPVAVVRESSRLSRVVSASLLGHTSALAQIFPDPKPDLSALSAALFRSESPEVIGSAIVNRIASELISRSDSPKIASICNRIVGHIERNKEGLVKLFGEDATNLLVRFARSYEQPDASASRQLTSYDRHETSLLLAFVKLIEPTQYAESLAKLTNTIKEKGGLTADLSSKELFSYIDQHIREVFANVEIPQALARQIRSEFRLQAYTHLLRNAVVEPRDISIALTSARDGHQSNYGTRFTGAEQRQMAKILWGLNIEDSVLELGGGATFQSLMLPTLHGKNVENPFTHHRKMMEDIEAGLKDLLLPGDKNEYRISVQDQQTLLQRFQVGPSRTYLKPQAVEVILSKYEDISPATELGKRITNYCCTMSSFLFRGQYGVSLQPNSPELTKGFVEELADHGMDILRVFDATNDIREVSVAIGAARARGIAIQPVLAYGPLYPRGVEGYVEYARDLIQKCGDSLHSLVIKDAGGTLEPEAAFELVSGLRAAGITAPIVIHTHETSGDRLLTLLEAVRASGPHPIRVDLGLAKGMLSSPYGQPDALDFLSTISNSPWKVPGFSAEQYRNLAEYDASLRNDLKTTYNMASVASSSDRLALVEAGMPGGMKSNFAGQFKVQLEGGIAQELEEKYNFKILNPNKTYTETGKQFASLYERLLLDEMKRINNDLGGIPLVTPTSQWTGTQAFQNVLSWMRSDRIRILNIDNVLTADTSRVDFNSVSDRYKAVQIPIQDFLLKWLQDPDTRKQYPTVNKPLVEMVVRKNFENLPLVPTVESLERFLFVVRLGDASDNCKDFPFVQLDELVTRIYQQGTDCSKVQAALRPLHPTMIDIREARVGVRVASEFRRRINQGDTMLGDVSEGSDSTESNTSIDVPRTTKLLWEAFPTLARAVV